MFLGDRRQLVETADPGRGRGRAAAPPSTPWSRCRSRTSWRSSRRWTGCRSTIRLLDPPLHEFLPDLTELSVRVAVAEERGRARRGHPAAARRRAGDARAEPDARAARRAARAWSSRACSPCRSGRSPRRPAERKKAGRRPAAGDHDPAGRRGAGARGDPRGGPSGCSTRSFEREGIDVPAPDRHDDRGAARRADRRRDRRRGGVLLLRHQRPDPDDVGLLPRRRRGGVLPRRTWTRGSSASRRSSRWTAPGVGRLVRDRRRGAAAPPGRTSSSGSAASTAATPTRCTSSTRWAWTTSPARRSACRWPAWRPAGRRWAASAAG